MPTPQPQTPAPRTLPDAPPPRDQQGRTAPSAEFLEFLGEWETRDGEWIDPTSLDSNTATPTTERETRLK